MAKRNQRGQGFSLYGLQAEISQAVDLITEALERQGVAVNPDALLLQFQTVVKNVGEGFGGVETSSNYGYLQASEDEEVPYSVAGDLLAIGYEKFKIGDRREAVKTVIAAMGHDDFGDIAMGLLAMNAKSSQQLTASEDIDESDEEEEEETEEEDDNTDDDDDDIDDDDIDALLEEEDDTLEANDDDDNKSDEDDDDDKEEPVKETPKDKPAPTNKSPMTEEAPITASIAQRSISNKLSMSGDAAGRGKGKEFLQKVGSNRAA